MAPEKRERKGRFNRRGDNFDDEEDPRLSKDLPKPSAAVTLFDVVKTKLDIKIDEPTEQEEQPKPDYEDSRGSEYQRGAGRHK